MNDLAALLRDEWPMLAVGGILLATAAHCRATLRLPNRVTLPLLIGGLALGTVHSLGGRPDAGTGGLGASVACVVLALVLLLPWHLEAGFPAGGVKLQVGFAAWIGAAEGLSRGLTIVLISTLLAPTLVAIRLRQRLHADPDFAREIPVGYLLGLAALGTELSLDLLAS